MLAVFQKQNADENLYALVFGESVLNDAVAIVLYRTLKLYLVLPVTALSILEGFGTFLAIFVGSVIVGEHLDSAEELKSLLFVAFVPEMQKNMPGMKH